MQEKGEEGAMHPVSLRRFQPGDMETLYRLDRSCFRPGIAYSRLELQTFLHHPNCRTVVVESAEGKVVAFAILEIRPRRGRPVGNIITIDVEKDARRQGLGTALMHEMEAMARREQACAMHLEVAADDEGAQTFYLEHGYEVLGRLRGYYLNRLDALVLEKPLSEASPADLVCTTGSAER